MVQFLHLGLIDNKMINEIKKWLEEEQEKCKIKTRFYLEDEKDFDKQLYSWYSGKADTCKLLLNFIEEISYKYMDDFK